MPFTPFHLGPAVLLGAVCYRWLDLPSLLVASVVVDLRTAFVFFGLLGPPLHGPFHTLLGSTLLGLVVAGAWTQLRPRFVTVLSRLGLGRERSTRAIVASSLVAVWLHVLLDATLYTDVRPFAPLSDANPLLVPGVAWVVYAGCMVTGVAGSLLLGYRLLSGETSAGSPA